MKILHVITSLEFGGAEKLVAEISPMIREKGHNVEVLAFRSSEPNFFYLLKEKGIKVHSFGGNVNVYNPLFIYKLVKMMKEYDIIHTHNTSPQYFAAIASLFHKHCKLVTTEHNTYNRRRSIPFLRYIDRWMYSRYKQIICISNQAEVNMRNYLPKMKNVCTVFNGVNTSKFYNASPIIGLHPVGKTVVVMVAAFRPQKDQKTLLRAFLHLPKNEYEIWIVGDGEMREEIYSYSTSLGFTDNEVRFFGNRLDIPEILHTADIVVMSSHYEGLSLSSVEGMSVNKPFVASDVDGLREVVNGYGVLFPHENDEILAVIIKKLSEDNDYYQQIVDKCWERAQMFDINKMVEGYDNIYKKVINVKS